MQQSVHTGTQTYERRDFEEDFSDDAACLEWLKNYLYPDGIVCLNPACPRRGQITPHHRVLSRRSYCCAHCGHHVHPTAGTIFHKSSTPLRLWFHAIYLVAFAQRGIPARRLQRELGVTYKTAWRMATQIRGLLHEHPRTLPAHTGADVASAGIVQALFRPQQRRRTYREGIISRPVHTVKG